MGKVPGNGNDGNNEAGSAVSKRRWPVQRKGPPWVSLIEQEEVDERFVEALPQPLSRETLLPTEHHARFPQMEEAVAQAERILAGTASIGTIAGGTRLRLGVLAVLLDAVGRGELPDDPESARRLWREILDETARIESTDDTVFENSLTERLLRAEVLIGSEVLFAGLPGMRNRAKAGRKRSWGDLREALDTDGTPSAAMLEEMPVSVGAVVRGAHWCEIGRIRLGKSADRELFGDWLRILAAMVRPDGSPWGSEGLLAPLLVAGMRLLEWKTNHPLVAYLSKLFEHDRKSKKYRVRARKKELSSGGVTAQSEWAKLMLARSDWDAESDLFFLRHDGQLPQFEWAIAGRPVVSGEWGLEISVDGEPIEFTSDWDAVSWFEDREVVYLELQWSEREDLVVCRQMLFSRSEQQLWLADAVSTPGQARSIEVRTTLPLVANWEVEYRRPLREFRIAQESTTIRGFPLTFPMEYTQAAPGEVRQEAGGLVIQRTGRGGVYSPLLFDWHRPRQGVAADWRGLTITEDGRRLNEAEAAAARVRLGPQQWVIYRNMNASAAMRAVIGYHHNQESVIASFTKDGEVDPLVLVEATDEQET